MLHIIKLIQFGIYCG